MSTSPEPCLANTRFMPLTLLALLVVASACTEGGQGSDEGAAVKDAGQGNSGEGGAPSHPSESGTGGSDSHMNVMSGHQCEAESVDAGDDPCIGCALQHCCDEQKGACIGAGYFDCVRECFEQAAAANRAAASWDVLSECHLQCSWADADPQPLYLGQGLYNTDVCPIDVYCALGFALGSPDDSGEDAGDASHAPAKAEVACTEECFPRWQ